MEYVSLHGYIRNTPSDTEVHAEYQLRVPVCRGKEYIDPQTLGKKKKLGGKTGVLVGLDLHSAGGGTEAGVQSPHRGNCLSQRRNI